MKHLFIVFSLLLAVGSAQAAMNLGVEGGLNFSEITSDPEVASPDKLDGKTGFALGVYTDYAISGAFSVRPEVMLITRGSKFTNASPAVELETTATFIDIPVLAKGEWDIGGIKLFGLAGPVVGFKISDDVETTLAGATTEANLKSVNFGLQFGGGAEYAVSKDMSIQVNARYGLGLTDLNDRPETAGTTNPENKAQDILVLAGVTFAL